MNQESVCFDQKMINLYGTYKVRASLFKLHYVHTSECITRKYVCFMLVHIGKKHDSVATFNDKVKEPMDNNSLDTMDTYLRSCCGHLANCFWNF